MKVVYVRKKSEYEALAKGPIDERGCTDILCCLVFVAFWVVFGYTI